MLVVGDKIRQTKEICGFNKVGCEFEIIRISEDGSITFNSSFGQGVMTMDEFNGHFEKIENNQEVMLKVSKNSNDSVDFEISGTPEEILYMYTHLGVCIANTLYDKTDDMTSSDIVIALINSNKIAIEQFLNDDEESNVELNKDEDKCNGDCEDCDSECWV
jgi:hypothetical protein